MRLALLTISSLLLVSSSSELTREQGDLLRISTVCKERYHGRISRLSQGPVHSWKVVCRRSSGTEEGFDFVQPESGM